MKQIVTDDLGLKIPAFAYDIPWRRLKTARQVEGWVYHLREKRWFTPGMEYELRKAVADHWHQGT